MLRKLVPVIWVATLAMVAAADEELGFQDVTLVGVDVPVQINHPAEEIPVITRVGTTEPIDEARVIRLEAKTFVVAPAGTWLVGVGSTFSIFQVIESTPSPPVSATVQTFAKPPVPIPDPAPDQEPEEAITDDGRRVWFYTAKPGKSCPPCDQWKELDLGKVEAAGITVITETDHSYSTPTFVLEAPGRQAVRRTGRYPGWTDASGILDWFE